MSGRNLFLAALLSALLPSLALAELPVSLALKSIEANFSLELTKHPARLHLKPASSSEVSVARIQGYQGDIPLLVNQELAEDHRMGLADWQIILCHEAGHILAGAPYIWVNQDEGGEISAEGQADYFAAAKCLRRLWKNEAENSAYVKTLPHLALAEIRARGCTSDQCIRISHQTYRLLTFLHPTAKLSLSAFASERPDDTISQPVSSSPQCRLDTMIAGAKCPVEDGIPFSRKNQRDGACTADDPNPIFRMAARPACWFNPYNLDKDY